MSAASIRIVIAALGGEGGGVLGKWIADMAGRNGYQTQTTSVPGVAQRTGATIYYLELFPLSESGGKQPVLSMFPAPGDVDLVICSEIIEAGRMVQRGFVTPQRTTLISSTHRSYGIAEKQHWADGSADKLAIAQVCRDSAQRFIGFDMQATARAHDSVINAALFGAIAAAQLLPFAREEFEQTIRDGKIAIEANLATFAASFDRALAFNNQAADQTVAIFEPPAKPSDALPSATTSEGKALLARTQQLPETAQANAWLGVQRLADYQDQRYATSYLEQLERLPRDGELLEEMARYLALWMAFEDLPRVAQLKIRASRFTRYRQEVKAGEEQPLHMVEYLHPRIEEFTGLMPRRVGRWASRSALARRFLALFAKPRHLRTNHLSGFFSFYLVAALRRFRRSSLAFYEEQQHRQRWFSAVEALAVKDIAAARELARCGRFIKGYSDTRERGLRRVNLILDICERRQPSAKQIVELRQLAVADEDGGTLRKELAS
ncbi:MAG: indolepyruvate oxidoreductase subunit beta family protein [Porticoccaceae bacterium]